MTQPGELQDLEPRTAKEMYLQDRENEVAEATLQAHGYRLERFMEWCDENDVTNMNDLTGRDIHQYKLWRQEDVNNVTLKSQLDTLRVFLRFCHSINGVINDLDEAVNSPSLADENARGTDVIRSDVAEEVLAYYSKFEWATIHHALFRLLWATGMRMGAARAIDLQDLSLKNEYVELNHRPEDETPLKNKTNGERNVALDSRTCNIFRDYINVHRHEVTDDHGRDPLFSTEHGRLSKGTLRTYIYRMTRPCIYDNECPHDREPDECEARQGRMTASKCPDSVAPHAIRRGAITHYLSEDVPAKVVSDRMNVSQDVISEHYDSRSEHEKMEQRRRHVDKI